MEAPSRPAPSGHALSRRALLRPPLRRLVRRPLPWWCGAVALAVASAVIVGRLAGDAATERARWGTTRPVLVLVADIAAGEEVGPDDLERRDLPSGIVPDGALRQSGGGVATVPLHRGEVLTAGRLARTGASAVAARLPSGTRGVAVPTGDAAVPLRPGDVVDVVVSVDPDSAGDGPPSFAVAREAVVVHVGEGAVTVAVPADVATRLAWAVTTAAVTLTLVSAAR